MQQTIHQSDTLARSWQNSTIGTEPDVCECETRCPCCGKRKQAGPRVVYYPMPTYYQPPLYWWQPGGSPTC